MSYIKRFIYFKENFIKDFISNKDLKTFLPTENQLIDMIDTRLLDSNFRLACQENGYLQLAASKLITETHQLGNNSVAMLCSLENRLTFDKSAEGIQKLRDRLGREANMDSILDDIREIDKNIEQDIDIDKQHVLFTSVLFDLIIIKNFREIKFKIESRFQVNYDEHISVLIPVEEEIKLPIDKFTNDDVLRTVDNILKKLHNEVITELKN